MAKHSVEVLIKARDRASKIFGIVGVGARAMGKALKSVAGTMKTAFVTAMRVAKYAVLGLAAAFTYCTYAALKQEAAEIELASALKMAGTYSDALMVKLKEQASAIQDVTVYGDEYILTLMRMAKTQGIAEDKLADTAKAAIALYEGFGGGRGKPEIFLRYYIDAIRGTGASLDSYVGALRNAKTEQQRQIVLQKALAQGWDVAKSKSESAGGALKQMRNKLGDVAETIARPFLPMITRSAQAIKDWADENEEKISIWAEKAASSVTLVKDMFLSFTDFMREDFQAAFKFGLDAALLEIKAFGEIVMVMMEKIYADLMANTIVWTKRALAREGLYAKELARLRAEAPGGLAPRAQEVLKAKARELVEVAERSGYFEGLYPTKESISWGGVTKQIAKIQREAASEIASQVPPRLGPAFAEDIAAHRGRMSDIRAVEERLRKIEMHNQRMVNYAQQIAESLKKRGIATRKPGQITISNFQ